MTSSGKRPKALSAREVKRIVLEAIAREAFVETIHARFDHVERLITLRDVIFGLENEWRSCKPEEFNRDEWQWKYRIRTWDSDDRDLTIIIALDSAHNRFEVVTRFHD